MKRYIYILLALLGVTFSGCDKWIDVAPEDGAVSGDVLFKSESGFRNALNGIYTNLRSDNIYGSNITMSVDALGQQFYVESREFVDFLQFKYNITVGYEISKDIWGSMYSTIYSCNDILANIEKADVYFTPKAKNVLTGELYALRALMHFDLLRIFHAPYASNPNKVGMAYMQSKNQVPTALNSSQIIEKVLSDLSKAEKFLEQDPMKTGVDIDNTSSDLFGLMKKYRKYRMNYYAVKALKARVLLYAGKKSEAGAEAKAVLDYIDESASDDKVWVWITPSDKSFSSEYLFGIGLYVDPEDGEDAKSVFVMDADDFYGTVSVNKRVADYLNANPTDQRSKWFNSAKTSMQVKYSDAKSIPMIKASEVYLIVAEVLATTDFATAKKAMADFIYRRTAKDVSSAIPNSDVLLEMVKQQYAIEFLGETQLFFYYKRNNVKAIDSYIYGSQVDMTEAKYTFPIPNSGM